MSHDELRDTNTLDPAWLTAVLHRAGIGVGSTIESYTSRSIGTGQVGENVRYSLAWDHSGPGVPTSVVAKFPSASAISRATAVQVDTYRKEVGFYRDLRSEVTIRTPTIHHIGWNPATHDFVLVMEDLAGSEQGDQLAGCSPERATLVVDEAVGLHAPTWGRIAEFAGLEWLASPTPERIEQMVGLLGFTLPGFVDRYSERLGSDAVDVARAVVDKYRSLAERTIEWAEHHDAWCVVHADYRLDNILFGVNAEAPPVVVVDWQTAAVGTGPSDIAYFVGAGLLPDDRRTHERTLVERYASGLRSAGVDIDDEAVWDGYVLGTANGLLMAIIASQIVERTDRGDDMFVAMAGRHAVQIADCGLLDRI